MEVEGKWILTMMIIGGFMGHLVWVLIKLVFGVIVADASLISFFLGAILMSPSYQEVKDYWENKYGK